MEFDNTLINTDDESVTSLDRHFSRFICDIAGNKEPWLYLAAVLTSNAVQKGHICLDLSTVTLPGNASFSQSEWIELLKNTGVIGAPGEYKPLILENNRLYLHKYWQFEQYLCKTVLERAQPIFLPEDSGKIDVSLSRLFGKPETGTIDRQRHAALVALLKNLTIISGGPGTGKTTTVAKIIAFLSETRGFRPERIALAAPTGKAAARMKQAFVKAFRDLDVLPDVNQKEGMDIEAHTIHRLLGVVAHSPFFRHNAENLLPYDVIIVDEASMVDFALMAKLMSALRPETKIILLGDKDQLASVEAGALFGDICEQGSGRSHHPEFLKALEAVSPEVSGYGGDRNPDARTAPSRLSDCVVELTKNYRFPEHSGIGKLSGAIRRGRAAEALAVLTDISASDISWQGTPPANMLTKALTSVILGYYSRFLREEDPVKARGLFDSFRVLCALRGGPYGVGSLNAGIERILASAGLVNPENSWYAGRPVMVTGNDYGLGLFNGDIGIALRDHADHEELKVFFPGESAGAVRALHPQRLPAHETVFAMTVHKAQGSEFDRVLLLLPPAFIPLLSRELLYTGITRAHEHCDIWASKDTLVKTIENRTRRMSGLREKLQGYGI